MLAHVPAPARVLGLAGLIPFVAGTVAVVTQEGVTAAYALEAQIFYAVTILTFLGAVHWGVAMTETSAEGTSEARKGTLDWPRGIWGVTPSLIAWIATFFTAPFALIILIGGLVGAFVFDLQEVQKGRLPSWYPALRKVLTVGAIASLGISLLTVLGIA